MALQLDMILQVDIVALIEITRHRALVRRGTCLINKGFKKLGECNRFFFVRQRNHFERRASSVPLVFDFFWRQAHLEDVADVDVGSVSVPMTTATDSLFEFQFKPKLARTVKAD